MQGHGVGLAPDMTGDHGHGTEFAHGTGVAQNHPIDQTPFDIGQGDIPEGLPARGSKHDSSLLFVAALGLHQRDQLPSDEGKGHEHGGQHNAGYGKDDLNVVLGQPGAQPAIGTEHQHIHQTCDHGRDGERQIDQGRQECLALELVLGNTPRGRHTEDQIQGHGNQRRDQRKLDGRDRIGLAQRGDIDIPALAQCFAKNGQQWQDQEDQHEQQGHYGQNPAHPTWLGRGHFLELCCLGRSRDLVQGDQDHQSNGDDGEKMRPDGQQIGEQRLNGCVNRRHLSGLPAPCAAMPAVR
ncbi:hypothetical protein SDC9_157875 [bioreactor metagenome]|uniref:Uncharacterized protein n=1 Tax=bioreactor metagenome TaxID=1076179 RepID=A0A645F9K3_9ZZZZ